MPLTSVAPYLSGLAAGLGLIVAIGAQNAFVLRQGLLRSHVGAVVTVCVLADVALIVAGTLGAGAAVGRWPVLLEVARWTGAAYLALHALRAFRRTGSAGLRAGADGPGARRAVVLAALGFTLLNPHVYLDTVVLLGSLAVATGPGRWAFAAGAATASLLWFTTVGCGARLAAPLASRPSTWRVLDTLVGLTMAGTAVGLVLSA